MEKRFFFFCIFIFCAFGGVEEKIEQLNELILTKIERKSSNLNSLCIERKELLKGLLRNSPEEAKKLFFSHEENTKLSSLNCGMEEYVTFQDASFHVISSTPEIGSELNSENNVHVTTKNSEKVYDAFLLSEGEGYRSQYDFVIKGHVLDDVILIDHVNTEWKSERRASYYINTGTDKTLIWIRMEWSDIPAGSNHDDDRILDRFNEMDVYFPECSYGRFGYASFNFTPKFQFPLPSVNYSYATAYYKMRTEAHQVAASYGFNYLDYDYDIVSFPSFGGCCSGWAGRGYVGSRGVWIHNDISFRVVEHEIGHNVDLYHANYYRSDSVPRHPGFGGRSRVIQYGDYYDTMGSRGDDFNHFGVIHKLHVGWVRDNWLINIDNVNEVEEDIIGKHTIFAYDHPRSNGSDVAVRFRWRKEDYRYYYFLSYNSKSTRAWQVNGAVQIHIGYYNIIGNQYYTSITDLWNSSVIINSNAVNSYGTDRFASPLAIGRNWFDPNANPKVGVTPLFRTCPVSSSEPCSIRLFTFFGNITFPYEDPIEVSTEFLGENFTQFIVAPNTKIVIFARVEHPLEEEVAYYWESDFDDPPVMVLNKPMFEFDLDGTIIDFNIKVEVTDLKKNQVTRVNFPISVQNTFASGTVTTAEDSVIGDFEISIRSSVSGTNPYKFLLFHNYKLINQETVNGGTNEMFSWSSINRGLNVWRTQVVDNDAQKAIGDSVVFEKFNNVLSSSISDYSNETTLKYRFSPPPNGVVMNKFVRFYSGDFEELSLNVLELSNSSICVLGEGSFSFFFPFPIDRDTTVQFEFMTTNPNFLNTISFSPTLSQPVAERRFSLTQSCVGCNNDYSEYVINRYRTYTIRVGEYYYNNGIPTDVLYVNFDKKFEFGKSWIKNLRFYDTSTVVKNYIVDAGVESTIVEYDYSNLVYNWSSSTPSIFLTPTNTPNIEIDPFLTSSVMLEIHYSGTLVLQEFFTVERIELYNCFGFLSNDSNVCSGKGVCVNDNICLCNTSYDGFKCEFPYCFGYSANNTLVCSGNGGCDDVNVCKCDNNHVGSMCEIPKCFGIAGNNNSYVCNGVGSCLDVDVCSCPTTTFIGEECKIPICYTIPANVSESVCFGKGDCISPNNCSCTAAGYYGSECDLWDCWGKLKDIACFHGECVFPNNCTCPIEYFGTECENWNCWTIYKNATNVCSSHGDCIGYNNCSCVPVEYYGYKCEKWDCDGIFSQNVSVCNSEGICLSPDVCVCNETWGGPYCQFPKCDGILSNNNSYVCNGNGDCDDVNDCDCFTHYYGEFCDVTTCNGTFSNDSSPCHGRGVCETHDLCSCQPPEEYAGQFCEYVMCYGYSEIEYSDVCYGHGDCMNVNNCSCNTNYHGRRCNVTSCNSVFNTESSICSGNGNCLEYNKCTCDENYVGDDCEFFTCYGIAQNNASVCSGSGECTDVDTCVCEGDWLGQYEGVHCQKYNEPIWKEVVMFIYNDKILLITACAICAAVLCICFFFCCLVVYSVAPKKFCKKRKRGTQPLLGGTNDLEMEARERVVEEVFKNEEGDELDL